MHYQISRNGQTYGPYTLDDLRRYLGTGNVLATDMVKGDGAAEWVTVEQLLATPAQAAPVAVAAQPVVTEFVQPGYGTYAPQPAYVDPALQPMAINPALVNSQFEDAPNLHWGLVLLFSILTCYTLFNIVWDIVIAVWLRKVQPTDQSLFWYGGAIGVYLFKYVLGLIFVGSMLTHGGNATHLYNSGTFGLISFSSLLSLVWLGLIVTGNFVKRASLLAHFNGPEPVGLELSGAMTFFFAPIYFQYHLNRINAMKAAAQYGTRPAY